MDKSRLCRCFGLANVTDSEWDTLRTRIAASTVLSADEAERSQRWFDAVRSRAHKPQVRTSLTVLGVYA